MSEPGTNEPMTSDEQAAIAPTLSPGAQLAACREQRGWTVDQVAAYLKLAPRQVVALESDNYAALPGMPIVRGFIRSYAKLLKIDATPLLAQLGGDTMLVSQPLSPKESLSTPFAEARLPSMSEKPAISSKWMVGLLLIVLLAAALWATQQDGEMFGLSVQAPVVIQEVAPLPNAEEVPQTDSAVDALPSGSVQADVGIAGAPTVPAGTVEPPVQADAPATNVAPLAVPATPAATSGSNTLNLSAREESWVEVRRASGGNPLAARLLQAGESLSLEVTGPVVLVVGNAAGVDASLRGTSLQLKGSSTTNVARLSLK